MLIKKTYKFRLKTNCKQADKLTCFVGCCRFIWNKALTVQNTRLKQDHSILSGYELCNELPEWKKEFLFLKDPPAQALQQVLKNLEQAFKNYFKGGFGSPKLKKKERKNSIKFPQGFKLNDNKVYLPKLGWLRFYKNREIEGKVKNIIVSRRVDKWNISIQTEIEVEEIIHPSKLKIGVDLGVSKFAALSNGTNIKMHDVYKEHEKKLIKEQRKLSKKVKFSNNWRKQKTKVQKIHVKIADIRRDFLHKTTTKLSKNHAVIVIEDLKVQDMINLSKIFNKSVINQGWYEFRKQLEYKQLWAGGKLIIVNPAYTSQTCSNCRYVDSENRKTQSQFKCLNCEHEENADFNAAKNILAAGQAVLACGGKPLGVSMKQESLIKECQEITIKEIS